MSDSGNQAQPGAGQKNGPLFSNTPASPSANAPAPRKKRNQHTCSWDNAGFERLWAVWRYPEDKHDARSAWDALRPEPAFVERMIADVMRRNADELADRATKYVGYLGKYIRHKRWLDEPPRPAVGNGARNDCRPASETDPFKHDSPISDEQRSANLKWLKQLRTGGKT